MTGVTVKGVAASYIASISTWRAVLTGTVAVKTADVTTSTAAVTTTVNAIDSTKTIATKGLLNDAFIQVFLLSGVTPTSVTLSDGTALTYNSTREDYEVDQTYTGTVPSSVNVVVTTASGTQTLAVTVH